MKFLGLGAIKGSPVNRIEQSQGDGKLNFNEVSYNVYGPKIMTRRKMGKVDAWDDRSLYFHLPHSTVVELYHHGIPLNITFKMERAAAKVRNNLLTWRLLNWKPDITVEPLEGLHGIAAVFAGQMLAISGPDEDFKAQIRQDMLEFASEKAVE
jgi:hypothetical protein